MLGKLGFLTQLKFFYNFNLLDKQKMFIKLIEKKHKEIADSYLNHKNKSYREFYQLRNKQKLHKNFSDKLFYILSFLLLNTTMQYFYNFVQNELIK